MISKKSSNSKPPYLFDLCGFFMDNPVLAPFLRFRLL